MDLLRRFEEAGHDGRGVRAATFWSWNDRLEPEEIRRQIREMAKGGLGGHFMHARRGCETAYLGPEWMEAVRAAVDEGRHTDVAPWLYDEDCWPSGACSGRVYAGREAFQQKHLVFEAIAPAVWEPTERTVAVFLATQRGNAYEDFHRLGDPRRACRVHLAEGQALLAFSYRLGEYADTFSREATEAFLKRTHEVYRESVGQEFGQAIPGIFTDEPCYGRAGHRVPWSAELAKFFQRSCGYDLVDRLPELFFPVGDWRKTRFDFYQSATRLFLLAWTLPVYQWCDRHGLQLTGHLMGEDTLRGQVEWIGAAMPHYEYMHIPGIDHLGRDLGSPVLVKQASSAAAQLGRPRVLSEMFGGAGWAVRFDDLRFLAEWQFALGVNLVCQHLSAYSLRGSRKRDFPPSLHCQQPWWPHYYLWNDYVARLLTALTAGKAVADVLVLHPISSAWVEYSPLDHRAVDALDAALADLVGAILATHADFHFGDPFFLERHGKVARRRLAVGACSYRVVVVPDATNMRRGVLGLLGRFRQAGGRIVFAGRVPGLVDGAASKEVVRLARRCVRAAVATAKGRAALRRALAPQLEVLTAGGKDVAAVLAQWRQAGRDSVFFFLNTDAARSVKATLRLPASGTPVLLDPDTGGSCRAKARRSGRCLAVSHVFGPRQSALYVVSRDPAVRHLTAKPSARPRRTKRLRGPWRLRRSDPNVLVLDVASWRTDEGTYSKPMPIMDIQHHLVRSGAQEMVYLRLEFDCALGHLRGRRFELVLEQPEAFEMWIHGMRTPLADGGPWWDRAFRRIDITSFVQRGKNVIELKRAWHIGERKRAILLGRATGWESASVVPDVELEAAYLVGDFAVAFPKGSQGAPRGSRWLLGRPRLVAERGTTGGTDLVRDGYAFFSGRMTLEKDIVLDAVPSPHAVLELPEFEAVTATVRVNNQEAGTVWKTPYVLPVGALLRQGRNHLAVTLTTSLRNTLGPHHLDEGESHWVGPRSFVGATGWFGHGSANSGAYRDAYNVVDFGLSGGALLRY
jgi:hypothetical protein